MTGGYPLYVMSRLRGIRGTQQRFALQFAVAVLALTAAPVWPAGADDAASAGTATATQDGWWNRVQGPQEGEPANPIRTLVPRLPAPPTVPATAIAVSSILGTPDKVAAVGLDVAIPDGGTIDSLKLVLQEATGAGASQNNTTAKVLACPVTAPWGPDKNASWVDRPQADCGVAKAEGVRADDGTWIFDLTSMGTRWSDPFAPLAQNGVVLFVDTAGALGPVQVSWVDLDSGGITTELLAQPGTPSLAEAPASTGSRAGPEEFAPAEPVTEIPFEVPPAETPVTEPVLADAYAYSDGSFSSGYGTPAPIDLPAAPEQATLVAAPRAESADDVLPMRPAVGFWEEVPAPTVLLVPAALGSALLIGVLLGPAGRPLPVWPRAGGLTRALARRDAGGRGAQS